MEAAVEHLMWLLYNKFVNYCFTWTTYRIVAAQLAEKRMTLEAAGVVLQFGWVVVALFGPSLPVLNVLIAFMSKLYSVLLFGSDSDILDMSIAP
eukprot:138581-Amphidinium_carterae.1